MKLVLFVNFEMLMLGGAVAGISKSVPSAVEINSSLLSNFDQPLLTHGPHVERVPLARAACQLLRRLCPGRHRLWRLLWIQRQHRIEEVGLQRLGARAAGEDM